jgi:hypothetical protein
LYSPIFGDDFPRVSYSDLDLSLDEGRNAMRFTQEDFALSVSIAICEKRKDTLQAALLFLAQV